VLVRAAVDLNGAEREFVETHTRTPSGWLHALFFDVRAEKADQHCSTFLLQQCGQAIFSLSCRAMVKIFENVF